MRRAKALVFKLVGCVLVVAHSDKEPTDEEWEAVLAEVEHRGELRPQVISTDGGGPNTVQRGRLGKVLNNRAVPVAIASDGHWSRGLATAMSWSNPGVRLFTQGDLPNALAYLDIPRSEAEAIVCELDALRRGLYAR